jgi:D-alanine-D-alanine ligase
MRIAVVHTAGAPCGCAEAVEKGLQALGHEVCIFDSEEIELKAAEIANTCDLVIDHSDTSSGTGVLRPLVRILLENRGARIIGSNSRACFLADDKAAAKKALSEAGIPVPPGIVVSSKDQKLPAWLKEPVVLKPVFEHMSRGLVVAQTENETHAKMAELLDRFKQPVIAELFIPGRELAISLLEEKTGLRVLPPLEWLIKAGSSNVLTEVFKQSIPADERKDAARAELAPELLDELRELSIVAFRTLGLRDYARFDVRLSANGVFYFLEANTTPCLEPGEALSLAAGWEGIDYPTLVGKMLSAALRRYGPPPFHRQQKMRIPLPTGPVDLLVPEKVNPPTASTLELARLLDVQKGDRVLDLGCGTGILAIAAARLGADRAVAADIDPNALEAAKFNALANHVAEKIEFTAGAWFEALDRIPTGIKFDLIIATPSQTPGHYVFGPQYGGFDGTKHLISIAEGAPAFLDPERGRLWLLAISLANVPGLVVHLKKIFNQVSIVHETECPFTGPEYEFMAKGLMRHLLKLRATGISDFHDAGEGKYVFRNLFIRASGALKS